MHSLYFIEITLAMESKNFNRFIENRLGSSLYDNHRATDSDIYVDDTYVDDGIGVEWHDKKKKKVKIIVNPSMLLGHSSSEKLWNPTEKSVSKFCKKLDDFIDNYFNYEHGLNDFKLSGIGFVMDVQLSDSDTVNNYMRVFHNIGRVKNFTQAHLSKGRSELDKKYAFTLAGKSNGVGFMVYGYKTKFNRFDNNPIRDSLRLEQHKNALRFEVKLTSQRAINLCTTSTIFCSRTHCPLFNLEICIFFANF